jgi:hypothetical protein
MAEMGSGKRSTVKPRFRAVFTEEALSSDTLEAAERLFARWVVRSFAARGSEASAPAGRRPGPQREDAIGPTDREPSIPTGGGRG